VIVATPALGVYVTEQLALAAPVTGSMLPVPRLQFVELRLPPPLDVKLTVPVGTVAAPSVLSVTVAVHVVAPPTATVAGVQLTVVVVGFGAAYAGWANARKVNAAATATFVKRARAHLIVPQMPFLYQGGFFLAATNAREETGPQHSQTKLCFPRGQ